MKMLPKIPFIFWECTIMARDSQSRRAGRSVGIGEPNPSNPVGFFEDRLDRRGGRIGAIRTAAINSQLLKNKIGTWGGLGVKGEHNSLRPVRLSQFKACNVGTCGRWRIASTATIACCALVSG